MLILDDKCTVPLGESDLPQSTGVRSHKRSLGLARTTNVSLGLYFYIAGVVSSVCMIIDVLENYRDSFHNGNVHVRLNDKVFQLSSALRHTVATMKIIREYKSVDDVKYAYPIQLEYFERGPQHNTTYWTVTITHDMKLSMLYLDLLVAANTTPSQCYANMAKRGMLLLNKTILLLDLKCLNNMRGRCKVYHP